MEKRYSIYYRYDEEYEWLLHGTALDAATAFDTMIYLRRPSEHIAVKIVPVMREKALAS